jgi:restriction system protein
MEDILKLIPRVSEHRNYWFIRTHGGKLYDSFISSNSIGVSGNKITIEDTALEEEKLTEKIKLLYPKNTCPSHTARQLIKFSKEIKRGDIVMIPGFHSAEIAFGEVADDGIYIDKDNRDIKLWQEKRRKVNWIKKEKRDNLDAQIYKLIHSRHTISSGARYAQQIDQVLHDFYIKGDSAYLILNVQTHNGIQARNFFKMGNEILDIVDDFSKKTNLNIDTDEIDVTVSLHSPGTVTFKGATATIAILGLLIVGGFGGGFEFYGLKCHSVGIVKSVIEYQDSQYERQMRDQILHQCMDKLEVKTPEDLQKVLQAASNKKEDPN